MQVGIQMFTVRNHFYEDPIGTFKEVAKVGYKAVELANHKCEYDPVSSFGMPAEELKKTLEDFNLKLIGAHIIPDDKTKISTIYQDKDCMMRNIEYAAKAGMPYLSLPIDLFPSKSYLMSRCEVYNKLGEWCQEYGIKLLYHNHYHEFQKFDGEYVLDLIMKNTDPAKFFIELDAYWTFVGATDPVKKIREYGDRIAILHEKDFPLERIQYANAWAFVDQTKPLDYKSFKSLVKPENFIEVGEGIIKIQDVIDAGNEYNIPWILIEQDYTKLDEFESIQVSMNNFRKYRGLEW